MTWNLRLVKMKYDDPNYDHLQIREVYYDDHGEPTGHCEAALWGETKEALAQYLKWAQEALEKPVLELDDDVSE